MTTDTTPASRSGTGDTPAPPLRPGDEAPPGTPGTGEGLCRTCGGSGVTDGGRRCPDCEGTGRVAVGIGGG